MKKLFFKIIFYLLLVFFVMVFVVLYVNKEARNVIIKKAYPLRAELSLSHIDCSRGSPSWMRELVLFSTVKMNAPSNQIVYLSPDGDKYYCNAGYHNFPISSQKISATSRFRYASITKVFTGDAVLQFINSNELSLNTSLTDVLGLNGLKDNRVAKITIEDLLLHQAGFDATRLKSLKMFSKAKPFCPDNTEQLKEFSLDFSPGDKSVYSNVGYCLLGKVIEQISSDSYEDYMANSYAFKQKGMKFMKNERLKDEVNYNYIPSGFMDYKDAYSPFDSKSLASTAGLTGNASSLADSLKSLWDNKENLSVFSIPSSFQGCYSDTFDKCQTYSMYTYQSTKKSLRIYHKSGYLLGLSALAVIDEKGGVTVMLSNGVSENQLGNKNVMKKKTYQALTKYYNTERGKDD